MNCESWLLLTWNLSLVSRNATIICNLIRTRLLLEWKESAWLWWRRRAIFLNDFYLVRWYDHLLASSYYLLLRSLRLVTTAIRFGNSYLLLLIYIANITCLRNRLRGWLLRGFSRNECNILQLDPLHDCTWRFSSMHTPAIGHLIQWSTDLTTLRRLTSTCITELDNLLWYDLSLAITNHRRLVIVSCLNFNLGWVSNLLYVIWEYSLLIRDNRIWRVCLCRFNLIRVWGCHYNDVKKSLYFV